MKRGGASKVVLFLGLLGAAVGVGGVAYLLTQPSKPTATKDLPPLPPPGGGGGGGGTPPPSGGGGGGGGYGINPFNPYGTGYDIGRRLFGNG